MRTTKLQTPSSFQLAHQKACRVLSEWHSPAGKDVTLFKGFSLGRLYRVGLVWPLVQIFRQAAKGLNPNSEEFLNDDTQKKYRPIREHVIQFYNRGLKSYALKYLYSWVRFWKRGHPGRSILVIGSHSTKILWEYWLAHRLERGSSHLDFMLGFSPGPKNGLRAILHGAQLFDPRPRPLTTEQRQEILRIKSEVARLKESTEWRSLFNWEGYNLSNVFDKTCLRAFLDNTETLATKCISYESEFKRLKPELILVPEQHTVDVIILLVLAKKYGARSFFLNHGFPGYSYDHKEQFLMGESIADRTLAWGPQDKENHIRANVPENSLDIVGNPFFDRFFPLKKYVPFRTLSGSTALVLNYARPYGTVDFFEENEERHFIEIVQLLDSLGIRKIVFKLHPGLPRMDFYQQLLEGLHCRCEVIIIQNEPFIDEVEKVDFVIGPISTAIFETLLSGKDYFLVHYDPCDLPPPFELNNSYVAKNVEELQKNICDGNAVSRRKVLNDFLGLRGDEKQWHFSRKLMNCI
jgi:hypothetical protein